MWRNYDAWGNSLAPQRPVSPTAAPLPLAPPTMTPNWFADGDFTVEYDSRAKQVAAAIETLGLDKDAYLNSDDPAKYREFTETHELLMGEGLTDEQQAASEVLRSAGLLHPKTALEPVTSRFKKSSKRRSRRRAPVVESDIYALSSDED